MPLSNLFSGASRTDAREFAKLKEAYANLEKSNEALSERVKVLGPLQRRCDELEEISSQSDTVLCAQAEKIQRLEKECGTLRKMNGELSTNISTLEESKKLLEKRCAALQSLAASKKKDQGHIARPSTESLTRTSASVPSLLSLSASTGAPLHGSSLPHQGQGSQSFPFSVIKPTPKQSNTPTTIITAFGRIAVASAAANEAYRTNNPSGLAQKPWDPKDFKVGDIIKAAYAAVALNPECNPEIDSKYVQAANCILQAGERLYVVTKIHDDCIEAMDVQSAGGQGACLALRAFGNIIDLVSPNSMSRPYIMSPMRVIMQAGRPIKDGSYIDLSKGRPIHCKENVTKMGSISPLDVKDLVRARSRVLEASDDHKAVLREKLDLERRVDALIYENDDLLQQNAALSGEQTRHFERDYHSLEQLSKPFNDQNGRPNKRRRSQK